MLVTHSKSGSDEFSKKCRRLSDSIIAIVPDMIIESGSVVGKGFVGLSKSQDTVVVAVSWRGGRPSRLPRYASVPEHESCYCKSPSCFFVLIPWLTLSNDVSTREVTLSPKESS